MSTPLWNKKLVCAFCEHPFETRRVRQGALRVKEKWTDFGSLHEGLCPYYYAITACPKCLVAARNEEYDKLKAGYEPKLMEFSKRARSQPPKTDLADPMSGDMGFELAVKRHELAIACHKLRAHGEPGELAGLWLHIVWMCRLKGDAGAEQAAMEQALAAYQVFFEKGDKLPEKLGEPGLLYLIGELSRRLGRFQQAREYYSRALSMRNLEDYPNIETLARDQMLVAKGQMEASQKKG
ncbi:MAG TPA: DUF2225 domain-containing protein [bacterium]|jgi:uncharacterized protein (DUF2225 family)|nr:DUF2225 domain-containing protein [bacterium]